MTDENGIENLENHESEENSRVGASHDLDGKFLPGHAPLKGAGRPPGSRKAARDVLRGAMDTEMFKRIVDAKLRVAAMGTGRKSLSAANWFLTLAAELDNYNRAPRPRRRKG